MKYIAEKAPKSKRQSAHACIVNKAIRLGIDKLIEGRLEIDASGTPEDMHTKRCAIMKALNRGCELPDGFAFRSAIKDNKILISIDREKSNGRDSNIQR